MPFLVDNDWDTFSSIAEITKDTKKNRGTCRAKTRNGTSCNAPPVWDKVADKAKNGRCKLHGGMSTGARTESGFEAIRESNRRRRRSTLEKPN